MITAGNYDYGDCDLQLQGNCNNETGCLYGWISDDWCETSCQNELCGYDDFDCSCDSSGACNALYDLFAVVANSNTSDERVSENEACAYWSFLAPFLPGVEDCHSGMEYLDVNHDGFASLHEVLTENNTQLILTLYPDVDPIIIQQVNCSGCLGDPSLYY